MNNKFSMIAGVAIFAVALGLSLQNAFNGYGVKSGSIHPEILAQTNTGGGTGTGSGSGSGTGNGYGTGSGGTTGGGGCLDCGGGFDTMDCKWTVTTWVIDANGHKYKLGQETKTCKNCAYNCNFKTKGTCTSPQLCPIDCTATINN
jgi:hypothetical protein